MTTDQHVLPAAAAPVQLTEPGVYTMPAEQYHADPVPGGSLSSTGARKLLPPSCPALFQHDREHGEPYRPVFEFGSAAHKLVLGAGPKLVLVDRPRWDTNEVKKQLAEIRAAGDIPLKRKDLDTVHAMAAKLREHPTASALFRPGTGEPERVLIWQERVAITGPDGQPTTVTVWCRALLDWLRHPGPGRFIVPDFKTCASAAPEDVEKAMARYGYFVQLGWYLRGCRALGLAGDDAAGVLVMQMKEPPYLVTVAQPDPTAMRIAERRIAEALRTYAECEAAGRWPGFSDDVVIASLPAWETRELDGATW